MDHKKIKPHIKYNRKLTFDKIEKNKIYNKIKPKLKIYKKKYILVHPGHNTLSNAWINNPDSRHFRLYKGIYSIDKQFDINRDGATIKGLNKRNIPTLIQTNSTQNLINIDSDNVTLKHLKLDMSYSQEIALTFSDIDNTLIQSCIIYGSNDYFAVFIAGRTMVPGNPTIDGFLKNTLDNNNKFINNTVISNWEGDMFSFSLQKNGVVRGNRFIGGKMAIYLTRNCVINRNIVEFSSSNGILVSLPSFDNVFNKNIILNSQSSGIAVKRNLEHTTEIKGQKLTINNNYICDTRFFGIEINNLEYSTINRNHIKRVDFLGIYIDSSNHIKVKNNDIIHNLMYLYREPVYTLSGPYINASILLEYDTTYIKLKNNDILTKDNVDEDYAIMITKSNEINLDTITEKNTRVLNYD